MANKFLTNVELEAGLVDSGNSTGTSGFLLSSTGSATSWVDPAAVSVGESEQVHIACKNTSGVAISKGDPVYITGTVGTSFKIEIAAADASNSAKMPAVGLAETDLANNAEGFVIVSGVLKNLTTDPLSTSDGTPSSNDTVYVKAGGGLTRTKPTGSGNLIQNVGKVGRVNSANAGSLAVSTIMRTNDVPNLTTGKIWVGSSTYTTESGVVHLDETNNRLGINQTSPIGAVHIVGPNTNPAMTTSALVVEQGDGAKILIDGNDIDAAAGMLYLNDYSTNDVVFGGQIRVGGGGSPVGNSWFANGNVGIGTTSPSSRLEVQGGATLSAVAFSGPTVKIGDYSGIGNTRIFSNGSYIGYSTANSYHDFSNAGSSQMRITSTGEVCIATTSPSTVGGTAKMTINVGSSTGSPVSIVNGTTDGMYIRRYSTGGSYQLQTTVGAGNTGNLSLQSYGGNVGIGTTSPSARLHVYNTGNGEIEVERASGALVNIQAQSAKGLIGTDSNHTFSLKTNSSERLTILTSGNVGIGTTSPGQKLHVDGNIRVGDSADVIYSNKFTTLSNSNLLITANTGYDTTFTNGGSERMRITTAGNVGIGTTSPNANLDVKSSGTNTWVVRATASDGGDLGGIYEDGGTNAELYLKNSAGTSNVFINSSGDSYLNGGNVGIGTTSPTSLLTLESSSSSPYTGIDIKSTAYYPGSEIRFLNSAGGEVSVIESYNNPGRQDITMRYNGSSTGGKVELQDNAAILGAGTSAVQSYLQVGITDFRVITNYGTRMYINTLGSVGIGTTSPGEKLEVNGSVAATAATDAYKGYIKNTITCTPLMKTANTSYNYIPYNSTIFNSTPDYFNRMVTPYDGRVKKIILRHISGTTPTATGMKFKKEVNGTVGTTEYTATVTGGASTSFTAIYNFANSDFTFSEGDSIGILAQTSGGTGNIGGASAQIIVEYNIT